MHPRFPGVSFLFDLTVLSKGSLTGATRANRKQIAALRVGEETGGLDQKDRIKKVRFGRRIVANERSRCFDLAESRINPLRDFECGAGDLRMHLYALLD
jgi:ribosomal protein L29